MSNNLYKQTLLLFFADGTIKIHNQIKSNKKVKKGKDNDFLAVRSLTKEGGSR